MEEDNNQPSDDSNWKFTANPAETNSFEDQTQHSPTTKVEGYSWTAENSSYSEKTTRWYITLAVITLICATVIYLITKDKITTAVIVVCGALVAVYGTKRPKIVAYEIDHRGFRIGEKYYSFANFRSFSLMNEGENVSVALVPLHRFMPYTYINFAADIQDKVLPALKDALPFESKRFDYIDRTFRRIGF